jgi:hypothetical protein
VTKLNALSWNLSAGTKEYLPAWPTFRPEFKSQNAVATSRSLLRHYCVVDA